MARKRGYRPRPQSWSMGIGVWRLPGLVAARGDLRTIRTIGRTGAKTGKVICRHSRHAGGSRHAVVLAVSATTRGRGGSGYCEGQRSEETPNRYGEHEMGDGPPHILALQHFTALEDKWTTSPTGRTGERCEVDHICSPSLPGIADSPDRVGAIVAHQQCAVGRDG